MKPFLFLLLPFLLSASETTEIRWSSSTPLTWADFTGVIDETSERDAWTFSGFKYEYDWSEVDGKITWSMRAHSFFDRSKSWVKKNKKDAYLLAHEQLHFNISELHCRYFKKRVANTTFTSNIDAELKAIYDEEFQKLLDAQIEYDEASDHYENEEGQLTWVEFVTEELSKLDKYKASNLFSE